MFFKKQRLDEDERKKYAAEINRLLDGGKSAEAFAKTRELEGLDKDAAGYFMAYFYFMGENVRENVPEALKRIEAYIRRVADDHAAWQLYGTILQYQDQDDKAAAAYEKAVNLGNLDAITQLANLCKLHADAARNKIANTLNVHEYAAGNARAISLYIQSMALYKKAFETRPGLLGDTEWQGYGRAADMMYSLSLNGEVKKLQAADAANVDLLTIGASVTAGRADAGAQQFWRNNAVAVTAQMEQAGYAVMAEYFRASFCMADCEKKKQEMMSNAKWHMDRVKDLSGSLNAQQKKDYPSDFEDFNQLYAKLERKYGKAMQNRLRAGELPDLTVDYLPDRVPALESNRVFAGFLEALKGGQETGAGKQEEAPKKKKGLFGRLF